MSKSHGFVNVSYEHLHMPGLNMTEIMLLSRISGFGVFFEAPSNTARFLNRAEKTIQLARQTLVRSGYIFEIENNGRGKKYIARADLRSKALAPKDLKAIEKIKQKAAEKGTPLNIPLQFLDRDYALERYKVYGEEPQEEPQEPASNPLRPSTSTKKSSTFSQHREDRSVAGWNKKYNELIPVLKRGQEYLESNGIPIFDWVDFRRELATVAKPFRSEKFPTQHVDILMEYLDYLESPPYLYQLRKNKYAPRITTQKDLWRKFSVVRAFAKDKSRHYDPSKVLTPE